MDDKGIEEHHPFRKVISKKSCFGCKLASVPLFYIFAGHIANRNYLVIKEFMVKGGKVALMDKFGMALIPAILFLGGTVNLFLAFKIFTGY